MSSRISRKRKYYNVGLVPSAVVSSASGEIVSTALPHIGWAGLGFVAYVAGLEYFNRVLIRYKRVKASKEVDKQHEIVKALADRFRKKQPEISSETAYRMAHKELEDAWIRKYDESRHQYKIVNGQFYSRNGNEWLKL